MAKITPISVTEPATKSYKVVDGKVSVIHTVKPDNSSRDRYNLKWKFDFAGVSQNEIKLIAARTLTIRKQGEWRAAKNRMDGAIWNDCTFSVREILDGARRAKAPVEKIEDLLPKLSDAEIEELKRKLGMKS